MGKTTAVNSILYALGMDGLIDQRHGVPLTSAMTSQLESPTGALLGVSESRVLLEVENHQGEFATLERFARRQTGDTRMIRVWHGRRITDATPDDTFDDMLARVPGSGTGSLAIGEWLETFVGWELPTVVMPDGGERRLYPELLFSLIFVEQRAGWRGIQAAMPTYGIPDVRKRVREYVLGLSVYERQRRRLELRREEDAIRRSWDSAIGVTSARLSAIGLRLNPLALDADFDDATPLRVTEVRSGLTLERERETVAQSIAEMRPEPDTARDDETITADETRLRDLDSTLQIQLLDARERERDLARLRGDLSDVDHQIARLQEDLTRNEDAQRLESFGGQAWSEEDRDCPTCHQSLPATLVGTLDRPTMTLAQNVAYIRQQLEVVEVARRGLAARIESITAQQAAARRATRETRTAIRALRDALVRARGVPSAADVERRITLERRREELAGAEVELGALRNDLRSIARRAHENRAALAGLPGAGLSSTDDATLKALETSFLEQLEDYQPQSLPVGDLGISRESYLPAADGVDLGFEISASDGIRLIWAYLLGLLETARTEPRTHHPGLVVFDEPRQQSAGDRSLQMLLRRASGASAARQQVLFATSEPRDRLEPMLEDLDLQYLPIEGRLLAPLD